jgi:hypothetical protein
MEFLKRILKNNLDWQEIQFYVFENCFCLMPVKSEGLKISLQTSIIYVDQYSMSKNNQPTD